MENNQALYKLLEAAALVGMVEELSNPANIEKLSPTSLSGVRITLRGIRETILASHAALAGSRPQQEASSTEDQSTREPAHTDHSQRTQQADASGSDNRTSTLRQHLMADPDRLQMRRRDLRASLEGMIERG
jgi:hypothetical protein